MAKPLRNVEIFAVGRWKGNKVINVTSEDLDQMLASFNELSAEVTGYKPMLKLGHQDQQKYFGQKTGAPALGFVERIWREGNKILADFANVPDALLALVEKRRYNAVSIEMYPTVEHGGKTFKNVLTAVALLGAELPAVKGLKELADSLFAEEPMVFGDGVLTFQQETDTVFTQEQVDSLIKAAVAEAKEAMKAEFAAKITDLEGKVEAAEKATADAVEAEKAKTAQAQKALFDYEAAEGKRTIERIVNDAIKAGNVLPKQKDDMIALGESMTNKVKLGDKEISGLEAFEKLMGTMGKKVGLSEASRDVRVQDEAPNAGLEVDARARERINAAGGESKLDYASARRLVLDSDPDLKARYAKLGD